MKIAIMDASTGTLTVAHTPEGVSGEEYAYSKEYMNLRETEADWMELDTIDGLDDFINGKEKEM